MCKQCGLVYVETFGVLSPEQCITKKAYGTTLRSAKL